MKAKRFLSVALCIIFMLTLLPMNTRALNVRDLFKDESKQGGLTINWYSASRSYTPTTAVPGNSSRFAMHLDIGGFKTNVDYYVMIDNLSKEKTLEAYNNFDRSVYLGSKTLSAGSLDADKWESADTSPQTSDVRDCYVWGEVSGYIKMPRTGFIVINPSKKYNVDYVLSFFGMDIGRWGTSLAMNISNVVLGDTIHEKDEFIPFAFRVGKMQTDSNSSNEAFSLEIYNADVGPYGYALEESKALIPAECFYSKLSLQDMQRFFVFNPDDYTLTLDPIHKSFPVQEYEYGIISGDVNDYSVETATGFQPLQLGVNHVTPDSGTIVIRHKTLMFWYISVGTAELSKPRNVAIIQRTPTTCTLSWKASQQIVPDDYKIRYDIYRRETGFIPNLIFSTGRTISNQYVQVGSTTDLTYTDKELKYYLGYEYFIQAAYPTGFSPPSDLVYTDSVAIEQMPSAPTDLKAVPLNQTASKVDLKISWSEPQLRRGYRGKGNSTYYPIKEYIIYRKVTNPVKWSISFIDPQEIARTKDTSYIDLGRDPYDECEYYVQSVESTGNISYFSSPLMVSIQNLIARTPKITPDTLKINNGDTVGLVVQYDDSYTGEMPGTWSVADSTIVSVEESNTEPITINPKHTIPGTIGAKVTGLKPGTTTVTFTNAATGISRDCKVEVIPAFKITPDPLTVYADETGSLAVTYDDGYKGQRFGSWSVDDNTVASIDQNGVVTGKKAGTAIVTYASGLAPATSAGGNGGVIIETASREKSAYDIVKTASVVVKPGNFTVNFDPNGGSPKPESVTVRHDTTVARPADPSMSDRQFLGWFTAPSGGLMEFGTVNLLANDKMVKKWDFTNDKVTEDMTLYARWGLRPETSGGSSVHIPLPSWPYITGTDTIDLTEGYENFDQSYTFGGYPAPTDYGISPTESNIAGATFAGNTLTIPPGLIAAGSPYFVTLTATNSEGTATKTVTVNVSPVPTAPTIDGPDTINVLQGFVSIEQEYTFAGNSESPTCSIPPELDPEKVTLTGNMLTILGDGLDSGSYEITLTASNSAGTTTKTVTVNIFSIDFGEGIEFNLSYDDNRIEAQGGAGGEFTYALASGSMPPGLTLNPDGTITGSADEGFYDPVSVVITDDAENSVTIENLSVHVYN